MRSELFSSGEVEHWFGTTRFGVVGLAAAVFTHAYAFFLHFPAAIIGAAVVLGSEFRGLAIFLVAASLGFSEASMIGREGDME